MSPLTNEEIGSEEITITKRELYVAIHELNRDGTLQQWLKDHRDAHRLWMKLAKITRASQYEIPMDLKTGEML